MKGLIRNTFYSMENNIKLAFLMAGFLILTPLITREPVVLSMITAVQIFIFIANVGTSLHADEISNWNRFELTLPVNVKSVILAKYISFCILIFFGFAVSLLTGLMTVVTVPSLNTTSLIWGYQYGLTQSITVAAIMFPVMLKIGTEKNELIILISAFFAGIFMLIVAVLLAPWTAGINLRSGLVGAAALSVSPLLLLISYFISLRIYKNKEF